MKTNNILIAGIGNTIRGDDGIGAYICSRFDQLKIAGVTTMLTRQLHTDLVEKFLLYDNIILADASTNEEPVSFYTPANNQTQPVSSSHHVNAGLLNALAQQLYHKDLPIMICAVQGNNFEMGEQLSSTAKKNADDAVNIICKWLEEK